MTCLADSTAHCAAPGALGGASTVVAGVCCGATSGNHRVRPCPGSALNGLSPRVVSIRLAVDDFVSFHAL